MKKIVLFVLLGFIALSTSLQAQESGDVKAAMEKSKSDALVILWTSDDPHVAERVALMYTHAAKTQEWFDEVVLIVWGPSAKLISENKKLREKVRKMEKDGVILEACVVCADSYEVTQNLKDFGFDVKGMGKPLSEYLKQGAKVLTF